MRHVADALTVIARGTGEADFPFLDDGWLNDITHVVRERVESIQRQLDGGEKKDGDDDD